LSDGEFIAFWLREWRVVADMKVNVWSVNEHVQVLIRSRRAVRANFAASLTVGFYRYLRCLSRRSSH
jgi:hypothetical protein